MCVVEGLIYWLIDVPPMEIFNTLASLQAHMTHIPKLTYVILVMTNFGPHARTDNFAGCLQELKPHSSHYERNRTPKEASYAYPGCAAGRTAQPQSQGGRPAGDLSSVK